MCWKKFQKYFYFLVDGNVAEQIRPLRRDLAQKKLELMTLNAKMSKLDDDWEERLKRLNMELVIFASPWIPVHTGSYKRSSFV